MSDSENFSITIVENSDIHDYEYYHNLITIADLLPMSINNVKN